MNLERYIRITDFSEQDVYAFIQTAANLYVSSGFTKEVKVFKNKKEPNTFLINFSENTDFERFKYLVSCMPFSEDQEIINGNYSYGYWTISKNDDVDKALYGKRVQLYVSSNEKDRDNVYAIAQDGTETIKLGFAHGEEYILLGKKEHDFFEKKQIKSDYYPPHIIYGIEKEVPISKKPGCSLVLIFFLCISVIASIISCKEKAETPSSPTPIKVEKVVEKIIEEELEIPYYQKDSIIYNWNSILKDFSRNYKGFTTEEIVSKNDHDDRVNDTIKKLQFGKSEIITVSTGDYFYGIGSASIQDTDFVLDHSIAIGIKKKQLEDYIKSSIKRDTIRIGNLEQTSIFEFQFSDDTLRSIIYEGYID